MVLLGQISSRRVIEMEIREKETSNYSDGQLNGAEILVLQEEMIQSSVLYDFNRMCGIMRGTLVVHFNAATWPIKPPLLGRR